MGSSMRRRGLSLLLVLGLSGCLGGGSAQFRSGQKAYSKGNLELAEKSYAQAVSKNPKNGEYKAALSRVRTEMAAKHIAFARGREKAQDWPEASKSWAEAAKLVPDQSDYAVRRDLSGQKAKNLGPDEWFAAVSLVADQNKGNKIAERSLAGARAAAYQQNLALAEEFLASGDGTRALSYFERAKRIDPSAPGLRVDSYNQADALAVSDKGDLALDQGDPIKAYELYQEAYAKRPMPTIKRKLDQVKRKASALLGKLDRARKQASRGRYAQALKTYQSLMGLRGVPGSMVEEVAKVRTELVKQDCAKAKKDIDRGSLSRAQRSLRNAVTNAQLDAAKAEVLLAGFAAGARGKPEQTLKAIEKAGLEAGTPLEEVSFAYALAAAKQVLKKAERLAKRDGSSALRLIAPLDGFAEELPGIVALRRSLRSDSFKDLLNDALTFAKKGNDGESAALLLAALNSSKAPDAMRKPATEGAEFLKVGRYAQAESSFTSAQAAAPRSRLAQRGIDIARLRRKSAEAEAVTTLKRGQGNQARAVDILESAAKLEPGNARAKAAVQALLGRIKNAKSASDAQLGEWVSYAARLASLPPDARSGLITGAKSLSEGDLEAAASAFEDAQDGAPNDDLPKLAVFVINGRVVNALKGDIAAIIDGDEAAAEALATLLKSNPSDKGGLRVLGQVVVKAQALAKDKNDAEAARYLRLATIATSPAPGLKAALDMGNDALAKGDMAAAESAYDDATDLEAKHIVAVAGLDIARGARSDAMSKAIAAATSGGSLEPVRTALKDALVGNPNSPAARKAFGELITAAQAQADAGNVARAAQLLEAANVVSKPESAKTALTSANKQLEAKDYEAAQAEYAAILKIGDSKIAQVARSIAKEQQLGGLVSGLVGLSSGKDLKGGAQAARDLLKADPANQKVARAVDAALARAEKASKAGDDKASARELSAVAVALSEDGTLAAAIEALAKGDYPTAQDGFKASTSELGRRGAMMARSRNLGTLSAGISGGGEAAAQSIRRLLKADPNNKGAKRAFDGLLSKATAEAKAGNNAEAAQNLTYASIAAGAPADLSSAIEIGAEHFGAGRFAEAERGFTGALELASSSAVAKTGFEVSKQSRQRQEQAALRGLKNGDPRPHALVLKSSLVVDAKSSVVAKGFNTCLGLAKNAARKGDDTLTAQALEAAATLSQESSEDSAGVLEGSALLAKSSHAEAQARFGTVNAGRDKPENRSQVAALGAELALFRRIAVLKADLSQAEKQRDVLLQSRLVAKILGLDARDRDANRKKGSLQKRVKAERLSAAKTQQEQGKMGVAYLYVTRALELDAKDSRAKAALAKLEEGLKKRLDLVMVVDGIKRDGPLNSHCKGFDGMLQVQLQTIASKRTDLGGYVLSPKWTEAVKKGDDRAPEVSGSLAVTLKSCSLGSSTGKAQVLWQILVPKSGAVAASGEMKIELKDGIIPRDEQDGAGKNARKAFSSRAAAQISEKISGEQDQTESWMMTLAEHGMKKGDAAQVADAWARMTVKGSKMVDVKRLLVVEKYLDKQFR